MELNPLLSDTVAHKTRRLYVAWGGAKRRKERGGEKRGRGKKKKKGEKTGGLWNRGNKREGKKKEGTDGLLDTDLFYCCVQLPFDSSQ